VKAFLDDSFLLESRSAEMLYQDYAAGMPIMDYHNHLSPEYIATNYSFSGITELWLNGDHYKWRAMRTNGIDEKYITGDVADEEKFDKWAQTVPYTMGNPLYHWTHLELQRYFSIDELLNDQSSKHIYTNCNEQMNSDSFNANSLLERMNVTYVCTTDDPVDTLEWHIKSTSRKTIVKLLPGFRPDRFLMIEKDTFSDAILELEAICNADIKTFDQLMDGLSTRIDFFHSHGCQLSDHGLSYIPNVEINQQGASQAFQKKRDGQKLSNEEIDVFTVTALHELFKLYAAKSWVTQLHLGALRNTNTRMKQEIGADVGCDSIGDFDQSKGLAKFMNALELKQQLPKLILYNLNPRDNAVFATMAGNFQTSDHPGKIQWGSAWWFLDQKNGMEEQLMSLSNMGLISRFIGMLTDSRSFMSFPRHEYFRRILCNFIGHQIEKGELPSDYKWIGSMIQQICYTNAKNYFNFN